MTETELARWAAIWRSNPYLARAGVDYGDLLDDPRLLFTAAPAPAPEGPRPLLPAQRRIATRMLREEQIADATRACRDSSERELPPTARRREGGGFVEPLRHHRWASSRNTHHNLRPLR